jgi:hypothetical protein
MCSFILFGLVLCLFRFNRNIETFCFDIEAKQLKQTGKIGKKTEKPKNFLKKIPKYAPYQTVSVGLMLVSVQSKHRNFLFRYRSKTADTNVFYSAETSFVSSFGCFESKLVSKDTLHVMYCGHEGVTSYHGRTFFL